MSNATSKASASAPKKAAATGRPPLPTVPWNPWLGVAFVGLIYIASALFASILLLIYPLLKHLSRTSAESWLNNSVGAQFCFVLMAEGFTLFAIYLFLKRWKFTFSGLGLKRPRWTEPLYGLLALPVYFMLYVIVVITVSHFVPGLNIDQHQDIGFDNASGVFALCLTGISLVVLPAITEEIMVRGFLYSSFKKALPTVWAALATSALFASAHLPEGGSAGPLYIAALDTFTLSLVLIYLREKTGSLWASITLHAAKNSIAFVTLFVLHTR